MDDYSPRANSQSPIAHRVVLWPRVVGKAIATGSQSFPTPPNEVSSKERVSTSGFEASKILWSIAWLLLNIFVAYPLANFLGWWWVIIMPFESMIQARKYIICVLDYLVVLCCGPLVLTPLSTMFVWQQQSSTSTQCSKRKWYYTVLQVVILFPPFSILAHRQHIISSYL